MREDDKKNNNFRQEKTRRVISNIVQLSRLSSQNIQWTVNMVATISNFQETRVFHINIWRKKNA